MEAGPALDAQAIRRCLGGDREAFAEVVLRHQDRVYGLCLRLCWGAVGDAADLAQETFVRAYGALGRFDPERPLLPWLLRIAVNLGRDRARRHRARLEEPAEAALEGWADPGVGPEEAAIQEEERRALRAAVAGLPEGQRLLIALAYDAELSLADIARVTGLPLTIVKNRLYRARRVLAARLRREGSACGLPADPAPTARPSLR